MSIQTTVLTTVFTVFLLIGLSMGPAMAESTSPVDHSLFDGLLKKYVTNGVVNYRGFQAEEAVLDQYLKVLEAVKPDSLSRNDQMAFYINAYNAWTVKLILTGYPGVESIKDLGSLFRSPWKKKIARINGDVITLDHIEHEILRPRFKDPRIHFAVNCASKGCPPLLSETYQGATLDKQLDAATVSFLNDPERNRLEGNKLYVSKIFDWFGEDFDNNVADFFRKYAQGDLKMKLQQADKKVTVKYLDYDWSLNGK